MIRLKMLFVLFAVIGVFGCDSAKKEGDKKADDKKSASLIGTWEGRDPEIKGFVLVLTFAEGGKLTQETVIEGLPKDSKVEVDNGKLQGTYKQDDKNLSLSLGGKDKKATIKEHTADKLVLVNEQNKEMTFTKKK